MSSKKTPRGSGTTSWDVMFTALAERTPNLYSWGARLVDDAVELRFQHRGGGEWMIIAKRIGDDGGPQVIFATAYDFVSAILAINAAMAAGKWREDRPWQPKGSR